MAGFWSDLFFGEEIGAVRPASDAGRPVDLSHILQRGYGIEIEAMEPKDLKKQGFQNVADDKIARFSGILQQVPELLSNKAIQDTYAGAYRLVLPDTLPPNAQLTPISRLGAGVTNTTFRDPTAKGKPFVAQAGIEKIDSAAAAAPQIAYAAFSVASVATGQYFMRRIDKKLESLEQSTAEILQFLELDKQSELRAQQAYLMEVYQNLDAIMGCEPQRQATTVSVQTIRQNALAAILFYREQAKSALETYDGKTGKDKIWKAINTVTSNIPAYWFSLHVYGFATVLELLLTRNSDSTYLQYIQNDLSKQYDDYERCYHTCEEKMAESIQGLAPNKIPFLAAKAVGGILPLGLGLFTYQMLDNLQEKLQQKMQREAKAVYTEQVKDYESARQLRKMSDSVKMLDKLYHSPVELAVAGDQIYIKLPEQTGTEAQET